MTDNICREWLRNAVEQSRINNQHEDSKIAANHEHEHQHFLHLIACAPTADEIHINLNDVVKFKLTDYGKDIFYHQYDEINAVIRRRGGKPIEPSMPIVDADGYTEMQLWAFMELFGPYTGMAMKNYIMPIEIIYDPKQ